MLPDVTPPPIPRAAFSRDVLRRRPLSGRAQQLREERAERGERGEDGEERGGLSRRERDARLEARILRRSTAMTAHLLSQSALVLFMVDAR